MQKIAENVYVEAGVVGCNRGFVVTAAGVVMIDTPQIPADAVRWRDEIARYGKVVYLIDTEPHEDHYTGNCYFGGTVVAHDGTREAILKATPDRLKRFLEAKFPESLPLLNKFYYRPPDITFSRRLTLHVGKHTFHLINLPGHTPYEVAVHIPEEGVIFTSDNVFGGVQPGLQQSLPHEWLESLKEMEKLGAKVVVPGHGSVGGPSLIAEMSVFMQDWIDAVNGAIDRGLSLEETQKTVSFADRYPLEKDVPFTIEDVQRENAARLYEVLKKTGRKN